MEENGNSLCGEVRNTNALTFFLDQRANDGKMIVCEYFLSANHYRQKEILALEAQILFRKEWDYKRDH